MNSHSQNSVFTPHAQTRPSFHSISSDNTDHFTLADAYDQIKDRSKNHHDEVVSVRDITDCTANSIRVAGEEHKLTTIASRALCSRLAVPHSYIDKLPKFMQQINLNHGLLQNQDSDLLIRYDGDKVRAVFSKRYVQLDNATVIQGLFDAGVNKRARVQLSVDEGLMQLNLIDEERSFTLSGDDTHTPGVCILNSELGLASFSVAPYLLRLVCTNGLITRVRGTATNFRHVSQKALTQLPHILSIAYNHVDEQKQKLSVAQDSRVHDPVETLDMIAKQFGLDKNQKAAVDWAIPFESGHTMFNIIQVLTKAAQFNGLSTEQNSHLQQVGGEILRMVKPAVLLAA